MYNISEVENCMFQMLRVVDHNKCERSFWDTLYVIDLLLTCVTLFGILLNVLKFVNLDFLIQRISNNLKLHL